MFTACLEENGWVGGFWLVQLQCEHYGWALGVQAHPQRSLCPLSWILLAFRTKSKIKQHNLAIKKFNTSNVVVTIMPVLADFGAHGPMKARLWEVVYPSWIFVSLKQRSHLKLAEQFSYEHAVQLWLLQMPVHDVLIPPCFVLFVCLFVFVK